MGTPAAARPAQCCQAGGTGPCCCYVQHAAGKQHQNRNLLSSQRRLTSAATAMQMDMLLFRMSHRQFLHTSSQARFVCKALQVRHLIAVGSDAPACVLLKRHTCRLGEVLSEGQGQTAKWEAGVFRCALNLSIIGCMAAVAAAVVVLHVPEASSRNGRCRVFEVRG